MTEETEQHARGGRRRRRLGGRRGARWVAVLTVLAVFVAGGLWWLMSDNRTHVTAYFDKAVGLYPGSTVRVLGVEVGTVDDVQPEGDVVRATMSVQDDVQVPSDARAVVVSPSLVSDRYVQLTPAYTGGPEMASGTEIPRERTATPVEMDDLYRSANRLTTALGPEGANKDGALAEVLNTGAANLRGNGENLNETIKQLGDAANTLQGSQGDLFSTVDNMNQFTAALAASDKQIHEFNGRFQDVSTDLAGDSEQMGRTLSALSGSLNEVDQFVKDNRGLFQSNVNNLTGVTKGLADQRDSLAEIVNVAPLAASNFLNAYDGASGSTAVRFNISEFTHPPVQMVCLLLKQSAPTKVVPPALTDTCQKLAPALDEGLKLPSVHDILGADQHGEQPPVPLPLADAMQEQQRIMPPPGGGPR